MSKVISQDQYDELQSLFNEEDVRPDYSGRGMYGATCIAYTGDNLASFTAHLALAVRGLDPYEATAGEIIDLLEEFGEPSKDSMGMGSVYYWRGIQVEGHAREGRF